MQQKNILIIICDQLSATALSAYGNTYSSTPNLDGLAARSAVMEYAYTSVRSVSRPGPRSGPRAIRTRPAYSPTCPIKAFQRSPTIFRRWENCFPMPVMIVCILARLMIMGH